MRGNFSSVVFTCGAPFRALRVKFGRGWLPDCDQPSGSTGQSPYENRTSA